MIINAMYNGKTVLFVAEKMAALEVVKKRIDDINLGCFCLELHSHKANKRAVLDQIGKALAHDHTKSPATFTEQINELAKNREYLNDFVKRIHEKIFVYSLHDAIVHYFSKEDYLIDLKVDQNKYLQITENNLKDINELFGKLNSIKKQYGEYIDSPYYAFDISNYVFTMKEALYDEVLDLKEKLKLLNGKLLELSNYVNANINFSFENVKTLIKM